MRDPRYRVVPAGRPAARRVLMPDEMAAADRYAAEALGVPGIALMENASRHVARAVAERAGPGCRIGVLCGGGNNGGDGFGAARHLAAWGHSVELWLIRDPAQYAGDAAVNLEACRRMGLSIAVMGEGEAPPDGRYGLLVDALLGTGLSGEVRGAARRAIEWMGRQSAPVVAVDIPSGVDGRTGAVLGAAVRAAHTVTFATSKPGHWLHPGATLRGTLEIVDIGMPPQAIERTATQRWLLGERDLAPVRAARDPNTHKGRQGHVYVLGGDVGRTGAVRMCADAALRAGAGLATIGTTSAALSGLGPVLYEVMAEPAFERGAAGLIERLAGFDAVAVGPGVPTSEAARALLAQALPAVETPMVIDADGLNHAVHDPAILAGPERVLTPHPGEAARLLGCSTAEVQADRLGAARRLVEKTGATVVLKGAHTLVHAADGLAFCPDGNPGMATAGMGDVLTGVIAALLARGLPPGVAARAGVLWHARAGDRAAARTSENHLVAGDLVAALAEAERS